METRIIQVAFEVPSDLEDEVLHEWLCRCIHEGYTDDQEALCNTVSDITIITEE